MSTASPILFIPAPVPFLFPSLNPLPRVATCVHALFLSPPRLCLTLSPLSLSSVPLSHTFPPLSLLRASVSHFPPPLSPPRLCLTPSPLSLSSAPLSRTFSPLSLLRASVSHFPPSLSPPRLCLALSPLTCTSPVSLVSLPFPPIPPSPFLFHPFPPLTIPYSPIPSCFNTLSIPVHSFPSLSIPLHPAGDGLTDDLTGLSGEQCIGIADWRDFYFKTYIHVGKLVGRFYDEQGKPRDSLGEFDELLKEGKRLRDVAKVAEKKYPGCNSRWAQNEGGKVRRLPPRAFTSVAKVGGEEAPWMQLAMGAERGWQVVASLSSLLLPAFSSLPSPPTLRSCLNFGVPRKIPRIPEAEGGPVGGSEDTRCACFTKDQLASRSDLHEYDGCDPDATKCVSSPPEDPNAASLGDEGEEEE
ncbi:unnamed protein product [Closterium sp. NIES-64]|nr:unnamed protein product [Closterium sp. NIES-64]